MITEYLDQLSLENDEELSMLEDQMRSYMDELTYVSRTQEELQEKSHSLTNIFSPRNFDAELEQNLENTRNKIARIN